MRFKSLLLLCQSLVLTGFTIELFLCGVGINWLVNEPRPVMGWMEDISITQQISRQLDNDPDCEKLSNISATSYNKIVLLIGQTKDEKVKQKAYHCAINTPQVKRVFNQITISSPTSMLTRVQDRLLFETIRLKLLMKSRLRYHHFKIIIENQEVFILGKAEANEAHLAATTIQQTKGVKKVIKLVEST